MSDIQFVNESDLPFPLEKLSRTYNPPNYAQVTTLNGEYVTFRQGLRKVIDVIVWEMTQDGAITSAEFFARFFNAGGYPRGRKPVIVRLGI